jgi:hypothetical protein
VATQKSEADGLAYLATRDRDSAPMVSIPGVGGYEGGSSRAGLGRRRRAVDSVKEN